MLKRRKEQPEKWASPEIWKRAGLASARARVKRSKDEVKLYDLCVAHFTSVEHNVPVAEGWDADIIIHDVKAAVLWNGPWHYRDMQMTNHSLKQVQMRDRLKRLALEAAGWTVIVFRDDEFTPTTAFQSIITTFQRT